VLDLKIRDPLIVVSGSGTSTHMGTNSG
jgi:hypothetical protein